MIVSLAWLEDYVDLPQDLDQLVERLTLSGTEVERVVRRDPVFEGVIVAEVTKLRPHPNADKLQLATVSTGAGTVEVVTGAPNLSTGDRVPLAPPGARLGNRRIEAQAFRGVRSEGMLCSAIELGLGEDASGILILDRGAQPGADLRELYPRDTMLHLEVKSNRPDLLAHLGVAREVAALFQTPLRPPQAAREAAALASFVTIEAPEGCRRFTARVVRGVRVGASPAWMQARLRAAGVRPISNVVDVTNFVMLELGQPMHAFDLAQLSQGRLVIRRARAGERLLCLDGKTRELQPEFMVVADPSGPQGIAGIIGGAASAVSESTTEVVLEAATWEPRRIRSAARALGIRTEASLRFEKGLSPALGPQAVARAAQLLVEVASGRVTEGADVYPDPLRPAPISLTFERLDRTLGVEVPAQEARAILERLEFRVEVFADRFSVTPPDFRLDCAIPEDVVEEVGRIYGYQRVPSTLPGARRPVEEIFEADDVDERVREVLSGLGLTEAVTYPIVDRLTALEVRLPAAPSRLALIANPIAEDRDALRVSLLPGLLQALARNARLDQPGVRLFEIGAAFWPQDGASAPASSRIERVEEPRLLALAEHVPSPDAASSAAPLRALSAALHLLAERIGGRPVELLPAEAEGFHPGRTAALSIEGKPAGLIGELHPSVLARAGLGGRVVAGEVLLAELVGDGRYTPHALPPPRYPGVRRDLTVRVAGRLQAAQLVQVMRELGGYTLREVSMLYEYTGPQLVQNQRNLTFRLAYQADDRTLTGEEVTKLHGQIAVALVERFPLQVQTIN